MSQLRVLHVHAFSATVHGGSPAGVCFHESGCEDDVLRRIAIDLGPSVTAFVEAGEGPRRNLRWFTREGAEVQSYCGHATFAAAHALLTEDGASVEFATISGLRRAARKGDDIQLEIPAWEAVEEPCPQPLATAIGREPVSFLRGPRDCLLVFPTAADVMAIEPDFGLLYELGDVGFICTAPGEEEGEIVFRFFCPGFDIGEDEDPATGSAHSTLAPYWMERLQRGSLVARQQSRRGATFAVERVEGKLFIAAPCATFLEGGIHI